MKHAAAAAAVLACSLPLAAPLLAQEPRTGVSTPPPLNIENSQVPATSPTRTDGYVPTPALQVRRAAPAEESLAASGAEQRVHLAGTPVLAGTPIDAPKEDVDGRIVTGAEHIDGECPVGTMLKVRMRQALSTTSTEAGSPFSAQVVEAVTENGRVLIPAGAVLHGQVTAVHGGRRIRGAASLHLDARTLTMPDGATYAVRAQVVDTEQRYETRIDSEGTIKRRDHMKGTLEALTLTTGSATVAGAMLGGGVGAAVGAGVGAGLGAAWWLKQDRQTAIPLETGLIFSLNEPLQLGENRGFGGGR